MMNRSSILKKTLLSTLIPIFLCSSAQTLVCKKKYYKSRIRLVRVRVLYFAFTALLFVLFQGCSKSEPYQGTHKRERAYEEKEYDADYAEAEYGLSESDVPEPASLMKEPSSESGSAGDSAAAQQPVEFSDTPETPDQRKRIYSGYCSIRVDSVENRKVEIFSLAEETGGYVESAFSGIIVIRVPAEKFDEIFETVLGLGEVVHKSIETYDVTEYFRDLSVRLEIAEKTRDRLYKLLEKTDDVDERVELLREIRRLTDEIERIRQNLEMIKKQISFSRITIELIPRLTGQTEDKNSIPFGWIRELDPLYVSLPRLKGRISIELEDGFAVFVKEESFRAESPEGTRVRVGTTPNEPEGDMVFWQEAIAYHLNSFYKATEELDLGRVRAVLFTSKDTKPFYYLTGVASADSGASRNKTLYIIEIFFPDTAALELRLDGIIKSLEGFGAR